MADDRETRLLSEVDAPLAESVSARLVDRFLSGAGLSARHRAEGLAQTQVHVRTAEDGDTYLLDFSLPLGSGNPGGYEWDGSAPEAEKIAEHAADRGIEDVLWDRENVGPTGWEPEFDPE